jgi:hypothetical protein
VWSCHKDAPSLRKYNHALKKARYLMTTRYSGIENRSNNSNEIAIDSYVDRNYGGKEAQKSKSSSGPCMKSTTGYAIVMNNVVIFFAAKNRKELLKA